MDHELVDRLKQVLENKAEKQEMIHHELHNKGYNDNLHNEIRAIGRTLSDNNNLEVII